MKTFIAPWRNTWGVSMLSLLPEVPGSELLPLHQCMQKPSPPHPVLPPNRKHFSTLVLRIRTKGLAFSSCFLPSTSNPLNLPRIDCFLVLIREPPLLWTSFIEVDSTRGDLTVLVYDPSSTVFVTVPMCLWCLINQWCVLVFLPVAVSSYPPTEPGPRAWHLIDVQYF